MNSRGATGQPTLAPTETLLLTVLFKLVQSFFLSFSQLSLRTGIRALPKRDGDFPFGDGVLPTADSVL